MEVCNRERPSNAPEIGPGSRKADFCGESACVVIATVATKPELVMICGVAEYPVDLALAVDHLTLAAVDEGLGTCWIGTFPREKVRDILKITKSCQIVAPLPMCFPKQPGKAKVRKSLDEIICYERFKE